MSKAIMPRDSKAVKALIDAGIIPAECTKFELRINATEPIKATCEFFVTNEQFETISKAFVENPEEAARIARVLLIHKRRAVNSPLDEQVVAVELEGNNES